MNDLTLTMSLNFICRAIIVLRAEELLTPRRGRASRHSGDVAKRAMVMGRISYLYSTFGRDARVV